MVPPTGSQSAQGYDLQTAVNVYAPFLLSVLLAPIMRVTATATAKQAETAASVRIVWVASHAADLFGIDEGVALVKNTVRKSETHAYADEEQEQEQNLMMIKQNFKDAVVYAQSKAACIVLATECAKRCTDITSTSLNPGNLSTELVRDRSWFEKLITRCFFYEARMGSWTELYAGWSPDITPQMSGAYVIPWGRIVGGL
ncbi:short-chain alcohol dehydrogenase [Pleosporales sp. CAS-2024a]